MPVVIHSSYNYAMLNVTRTFDDFDMSAKNVVVLLRVNSFQDKHKWLIFFLTAVFLRKQVRPFFIDNQLLSS